MKRLRRMADGDHVGAPGYYIDLEWNLEDGSLTWSESRIYAAATKREAFAPYSIARDKYRALLDAEEVVDLDV